VQKRKILKDREAERKINKVPHRQTSRDKKFEKDKQRDVETEENGLISKGLR
jgi:hypothetical protein